MGRGCWGKGKGGRRRQLCGRPLILVLTLVAVLWGPAMAAAQDAAAAQILAAADARRWPGQPFRMIVTVVPYFRQKPGPPAVLVAHGRGGEGGGSTLLRFTAPAEVRGRVMLRVGRSGAVLAPGSPGPPAPLSPLQPLVGGAALVDMAVAPWGADFLARRAGEETIPDSDRRQRRCHHLTLQALSANVGYERGEVWVATDGQQPVKARFFNDRGKLIKTIFYRRVRDVMGALRPTEAIIIDGQDTDHITTVSLDSFVPSPLKLDRFHPERMAEFRED